MWQIITYAFAVSAALSLLGFCEEKLAIMLGKPRRFIWALSIVISIVWPLAAITMSRPATVAASMIVNTSAPPTAAPELSAVAGQPLEATAVRPARPNSTAAKPAASLSLRPPSDRTVLVAWALLSGTMLLYLIGADMSLRRRVALWRRETICDQSVQVSESTGPALFGVLRPRIVVPHSFLGEPAATQSLILEHELQHLRARDPLLLRLALFIVAAAPWNLPLWWQLRRLRRAIELDCDARVLRSGAEAALYGGVLLTVSQRAGNMPLAAIAMSEPVSALELRIRSLAAGPARYSVPRALAILGMWGAGVGVAVSLEAPAIPSGNTSIPAAPGPAAGTQPCSGPGTRCGARAGYCTFTAARAAIEVSRC
jgi:bla regulator protein blaR1